MSKTPGYRLFYTITGPFLPLMKWAFPTQITTTEQLGRAMLNLVRRGYPRPILESSDINSL